MPIARPGRQCKFVQLVKRLMKLNRCTSPMRRVSRHVRESSAKARVASRTSRNRYFTLYCFHPLTQVEQAGGLCAFCDTECATFQNCPCQHDICVNCFLSWSVSSSQRLCLIPHSRYGPRHNEGKGLECSICRTEVSAPKQMYHI